MEHELSELKSSERKIEEHSIHNYLKCFKQFHLNKYNSLTKDELTKAIGRIKFLYIFDTYRNQRCISLMYKGNENVEFIFDSDKDIDVYRQLIFHANLITSTIEFFLRPKFSLYTLYIDNIVVHDNSVIDMLPYIGTKHLEFTSPIILGDNWNSDGMLGNLLDAMKDRTFLQDIIFENFSVSVENKTHFFKMINEAGFRKVFSKLDDDSCETHDMYSIIIFEKNG